MSILGVNSALAGAYQYANRTQKTGTNRTGFTEQLQKTGEAADTSKVDAYTEYLRSKYGNVRIQSVGKDQKSLDRVGKSMSGSDVVIAPNILEQMANDPEKAAYYDDRISGTRFDRPGFNVMMEEVEAGRVEAIVVKDMSRLRRDYLKAGQIMEILRIKGVRLIAINGSVDSANGDDDFTPFRNIMNALIDQDIPVLMTNIPSILNLAEDRAAFISALDDYSLLILDDLGVERNTGYALEQMFLVIDSRYRSRKPLIVTTNLKLEEIRNSPDLAHARIYDRIMERCAPVLFSGRNFREEKAAATKEAARGIASLK